MYPDPDINPNILVAVGKVIIAIAWADGEIQDEEKECIKAMLSNVSDLSNEHLEILEDFLSEPVEPTEREIIIDELAKLITNLRERNFALYWLNDIVNAKGSQDEREMEIYEAVNARFIQKDNSKFTEQEEISLHDEKGEFDVDAFVKLNVKEMKKVVGDVYIADTQYRKMVLVGNLIACITRADNRISECEVQVMRDYVMGACDLTEDTAHAIVKVILSMDIEKGNTLSYVCSDLYENTNKGERMDILKVLFDVSMDDSPLDFSELNRIIHICASLKIEQSDFENALSEYDALIAAC